LDRGTRRPDDQPRWLTYGTSTSASVHGSDRVDRVKTADVRVEQGLGGLGGRPVEDGGHTCRVARDAYGVRYSRRFGGLSLKTIGWTGLRVWASKPGGGFEEEQTARGGIKEFTSKEKLSHEGRGGRQMKITSGCTTTASGHVVRLKISNDKTRIV
jgi:hypothetical protein